MVCLGIRPNHPQTHHLGRETFLAPVEWDADGWPQVGYQGRIALQMEAPHLTPVIWAPPAVRDDFEKPDLDLNWNFLGNPNPDDWSLTRRPGSLCLQGRSPTLDDGAGVVFLGRRQEHFNCEAATRIDFSPDGQGAEAGLVAWMDPRHHAELFVTCEEDKRIVSVRRRIGSLSAIVARQPIPDKPATLQIRANKLFYTFSWIKDNDEEYILAIGETRYLSSEVAGGFTGVYFALYASGNGRDDINPVFFDWFDYRNLENLGYLGIDSPLRDLLANASVKGMLTRQIPQILSGPVADWQANFSLIDLAGMLPEKITPQAVIAIDKELRAAEILY